jgi:ArsR family transcriptional regulator
VVKLPLRRDFMKGFTDVQKSKTAILKGIAHPVRMRIVEELSRGDLCAGEIAELFHFDRTTISKHLALMKDLGILESSREGTSVRYSLRMICLAQLLCCIENVLEEGNTEELPLFCGCGPSISKPGGGVNS